MGVRDFVGKIAFLCGAKNAERISDIFLYVYDKEIAGKSVFDRNSEDIKDISNRSIFLWDMLYQDSKADIAKVDYCKDLMEIIERSHYLKSHGEKHQANSIDYLEKMSRKSEPSYVDIAEYMTVDDAIVLGWST